MTLTEVAEQCAGIRDEVGRVIVGKRDVLRLVLLGILAGGGPGLARVCCSG